MGRELCLSLKMKCHTAARRVAKTPIPRASVKRRAQPTQVSKITTAKPAGDPSRSAKLPITAVSTASTSNVPVPIPRSKPAIAKAEPSEVAPATEPIKKPVIQPASVDLPPLVPEADCFASLRSAKVVFDTMPAQAGTGDCHVDEPVRLHAVQTLNGMITLPDSPVFNCRFALQFALWLSDTGAAIVSSHLNSPLAKVSTGPGYQCRGRNGDSSAKLSEHGFGNAVDITTLTTADGRTVQISDAINSASPSFETLRGLRTAACGYFTTVLGPGANAAHASHFHFDLGMHGKSANYRICE